MATKRKGGPKTAGTKIEPAKGKLGVMVVGMGAVATTSSPGAGQADWVAYADGHDPAGEADG